MRARMLLALSALALFVVGPASAALPPNSVGSPQVKPDSLKGIDIDEATLGKVPRAGNADRLGGRVPSAYQRRVSGTCPASQAVFAVNVNGSLQCLPVAEPPAWDDLTGVPAGFADGLDDDTTYASGAGLDLVGTLFAVDFGTGFDEVARGDHTHVLLERPGFDRTAVDSSDAVGFMTSATIGSDGLGVVSYYDHTHGALKVAHCEDLACDSAGSETVDDVGNAGAPSSIAIGADGFPLVSYAEATEASQELRIAHCEDVTCTSATKTTLDSVGQAGIWNAITVGADGRGLIAYWANAALKVAHCDDLACTSATTTTYDSEGNVGLYASITIGADGFGLIAFRDNHADELKVLHCENVSCSSAAINTFDTNELEASTAITTGEDGLGLIAYVFGRNTPGGFERDLKVAHCENAACSLQSDTTVATGLTADSFSVTVGGDGRGLVSYAAGGLSVAHCNDPACSSATTAAVDPGGGLGETSSATIGSDGLALISYWDSGAGDLKVAHCSNPFCVPYFRRR
jgi:hypothetical protein